MTTEPTITVEQWCYSSIGGDYCYFPGDPEIPGWEEFLRSECDYWGWTDCPIPSYTKMVVVPNPDYTGPTTTTTIDMSHLLPINTMPPTASTVPVDVITPPVPSSVPSAPATTMQGGTIVSWKDSERTDTVVGIPTTIAPYQQQLPVTGIESTLVVAATVLVAVGSALLKFALRRPS